MSITPIRGTRPTAEESDLALIRAALHEHGQLLALLLASVTTLTAKVDELLAVR